MNLWQVSQEGRYLVGSGHRVPSRVYDSHEKRVVDTKPFGFPALSSPSGEWIGLQTASGDLTIQSFRNFLNGGEPVKVEGLGIPWSLHELERNPQFVRLLWFSSGGLSTEVKLHLNSSGNAERVEILSQKRICEGVAAKGQPLPSGEDEIRLSAQLDSLTKEVKVASEDYLALRKLRDLASDERLVRHYGKKYQEAEAIVKKKSQDRIRVSESLNGKPISEERRGTLSLSVDAQYVSFENEEGHTSVAKVEGSKCLIEAQIPRRTVRSELGLSSAGQPPPHVFQLIGDWDSQVQVQQNVLRLRGSIHSKSGFLNDGRGYTSEPEGSRNVLRIWDPRQIFGSAEEKQRNCTEKKLGNAVPVVEEKAAAK